MFHARHLANRSCVVRESCGRPPRCAVAARGIAVALFMLVSVFSAYAQPIASGGDKLTDRIELAQSRDARIVDFAPGVRIDWSARVVEVSAKVAFRRGPLELLACAPHSREHESVLVVSARPYHIYQAIGLLGAEPGHPPTYSEKLQRMMPPSGAEVSVTVRFGKGHAARKVPARDLVRLANGEAPTRLRWVFSGSRRHSDGGFAADVEGAVACVVDFPSALLSLDRSHSADDDQLWLSANTPQIPPVGTACVLLIGVGGGRSFTLSLDDEGRLWRRSTIVTPAQAAAALAKERLGTVVHLVALVDVEPSPAVVRAAIRSLVDAGIEAGRLTTDLETGEHP